MTTQPRPLAMGGLSWSKLLLLDGRSSSPAHQLVSLGVAGGWRQRCVIHEAIELTGGSSKTCHVPTSPLTQKHEQALQFRKCSERLADRRCLWGYLRPLNHTCPLCKGYTRISRGQPTSVRLGLQPHPIFTPQHESFHINYQPWYEASVIPKKNVSVLVSNL